MLHHAREAPVSMLFSQPLSPLSTPGLVDLLTNITSLPGTLSAIPTASSFWYVVTVFPSIWTPVLLVSPTVVT